MSLLWVNICSTAQDWLKPTVRVVFELMAEQGSHFIWYFGICLHKNLGSSTERVHFRLTKKITKT